MVGLCRSKIDIHSHSRPVIDQRRFTRGISVNEFLYVTNCSVDHKASDIIRLLVISLSTLSVAQPSDKFIHSQRDHGIWGSNMMSETDTAVDRE